MQISVTACVPCLPAFVLSDNQLSQVFTMESLPQKVVPLIAAAMKNPSVEGFDRLATTIREDLSAAEVQQHRLSLLQFFITVLRRFP